MEPPLTTIATDLLDLLLVLLQLRSTASAENKIRIVIMSITHKRFEPLLLQKTKRVKSLTIALQMIEQSLTVLVQKTHSQITLLRRLKQKTNDATHMSVVFTLTTPTRKHLSRSMMANYTLLISLKLPRPLTIFR